MHHGCALRLARPSCVLRFSEVAAVDASRVRTWVLTFALTGCGMGMPSGEGGPSGSQALSVQQCTALASQYAATETQPDVCDSTQQCQVAPPLPARLDTPGCCIPLTQARAEVLAPLRAQYVAGGCGTASCGYCPLPYRPPCEDGGMDTCN
jgi:hypothetical protein